MTSLGISLIIILMPIILVVDDDQNVRSVLGDQLETMGHKVFFAEDGLTVFQKIQDHKPDLVILDYKMPAANGATVLSRLRSSSMTAFLPVLFLSGIPVEEIKKEVPESRLVSILEKPVDMKVFTAVLDELLKGAPPRAA